MALAGAVFFLANAHASLCRSDATSCMKWLKRLPLPHYRSGYAQQLLGSAYFAISDYRACMLVLREMLRMEPYRTAGLEILSTALWHLKKEKELAALAQQSTAVDKLSPEVWCVVGNCFSLQREHQSAIRFFERALQLNTSFVYAHTLCGHEHFANDNLDKAIASFRLAIALDERHFNAWYGLGVVFFRQERLDLAEHHFRRALSLNPNSSVLRCYLGMVLHQSADGARRMEALEVLQDACLSDSRNAQLHFQLAHVLLALDRVEDAYTSLQVVQELAPREAPVFSLLGQVCLRLGYRAQAAGHFNTAVALDGKEAAAMKLAYETFDPSPL